MAGPNWVDLFVSVGPRIHINNIHIVSHPNNQTKPCDETFGIPTHSKCVDRSLDMSDKIRNAYSIVK